MPVFDDYNRTIIGYHGTTRATALALVQRQAEFRPSRNDDDWLGHGVYFWEHAPRQAWRWARQRCRSGPVAVVASMIRLGNCLDLLDPVNVVELRRMHQSMIEAYAAAQRRVPRNANARKRLDCAVFQYAYEAIEIQEGRPIDTCRAVYVPTDARARLWERSWLSAETHVQLCVRNQSCILGTWLVKEPANELEGVLT